MFQCCLGKQLLIVMLHCQVRLNKFEQEKGEWRLFL